MLYDVGNNRDCDVDVDHRNNTKKDITEVKIFQKDFGVCFFLKHPVCKYVNLFP